MTTLRNQKPLFISVEGVDGCGKSTQIIQLSEWLRAQGIDLVQTREPGGTLVGRQIRSILLEGDADKFDGTEELLLFGADRHLHLRTVVRPALEEGRWVITDRFADSSTVFQQGRNVPEETIIKIHSVAVGETWPDLTLILDLSPEEALRRSLEKARNTGMDETRFESLGVEFQQTTREGFLQIARENPKRCRVIDANGTPEDVQQRLRDAVLGFANQTEQAA